MFTAAHIVVLCVIAGLGHAMALLWHVATRSRSRICRKKIYDLSVTAKQIRRELKNSLHAPVHAVVLAAFLYAGYFKNTSQLSFIGSLLATAVWAEIWHYGSHRAFHLNALHWIHAEHHKSHLNSGLTAISFSFPEKLIFDLGLLAPLMLSDAYVVGLNFFGIAVWYIGYLLINSLSHANFELKSRRYNHWLGGILTSTTYHALHHSRYTGNYGLGTRLLDRLFGTEWDDYEALFDRISDAGPPLATLRERVAR